MLMRAFVATSAFVLALTATVHAESALTVPESELAAALTCPAELVSGRDAVLLVHGTAGTAEDHWGWSYAKALPAQGYDVCMTRLPKLALGDIQIAAEYVVFAIRKVAARSTTGKVDVIGISQGGLEPRWALRWWPSLRALVDDYVSLASPQHGALSASALCPGECAPAVHQMKLGSAFIDALNSCDETPGGVDYTSIYSLNDELVQPVLPEPTAALDGASNVLIQDVCPARPVHHAAEVYDAAVFAVVRDALENEGPADVSRVDPAVCLGTTAPGITEFDAIAGNLIVYGNGYIAFGTFTENTDVEPPLAAYVDPTCAP